MPISFEYCQGPCSYLIATFSGKITDSEFLTAWKDFLKSDKWKPGALVLDDLSNADLSGLTTEGITAYVDYLESSINKYGESIKSAKVALYAPMTLHFGMSRMFDTLGSETTGEIKVFKDRQQAIDWLTE